MGNTNSTSLGSSTELVVYGFVRRCQSQFLKKTIPSQLFKLIFQYYQLVNIYGIGLNQFGSLGLGYKNIAKDVKKYQKLESLENIVISQIYKGFQSFLFLNYQNRIYVTGNNVACQLGIQHNKSKDNDNKSILVPTIIKYFSNKKSTISLVSNGVQAKHTFFKTSSNKIYALGNNTYYQIPQHKSSGHTIMNPVQIKCAYNIQNIQCGEDFSLFLDNNGYVYSSGSNIYGQLGCSKDFQHQLDLTKVDGLSDIVSIECGNQHSLCVDSKGILFGFGNNINGQLAINYKDVKFIYAAKVIVNNTYCIVKTIRCGAKHSGFIDNQNKLYLFGSNRGGQCGNGKIDKDISDSTTPIALQNIKIDNFDCGSRHTVVLTSDNHVYAFGFNQYHQCSIKDKSRYIYEPYFLKKSEIGIVKGSILNIIAGSYSTLIVTN